MGGILLLFILSALLGRINISIYNRIIERANKKKPIKLWILYILCFYEKTITWKKLFMKRGITMLKKICIILMVLVLALPLSACGGNSGNNSNNQMSQENSTTNTNTNVNTNTNANTDTNINTNVNTDANTGTQTDSSNTGTTTNVGYKDIKLTPEEAYDIYAKKYPNTKIYKLALDLQGGSYEYEVEGYDDTNKYELKIEPVDGKILKEEQEKRDSNDKKGEITLENVNKIQELIDKALKDAGNSYKVDQWELKSENDQSVFEIEVVDSNDNDIEYKYNIKTMELIEKDK